MSKPEPEKKSFLHTIFNWIIGLTISLAAAGTASLLIPKQQKTIELHPEIRKDILSGKYSLDIKQLNLFEPKEQTNAEKLDIYLATTPDDEVKANFQYSLKLAESGDAIHQGSIATHYLEGMGVEKDSKKALEWLNKSAEGGFATAQFTLAGCYITGLYGVDKDYQLADKWLSKAATQGDERAIRILAKLRQLQNKRSK